MQLLTLPGLVALVRRPAEVDRPVVFARDHTYLLPARLADVRDPQLSGRMVEGKAPGVAEAVRDNPPSVAGAARIVTEDLPSPVAAVEPLGVHVAQCVVADGRVETTVRPELELTALVPRQRLGDDEEHPRRGGVGVTVPCLILGDDDTPAPVRVVDVETAARRVIGRERDREESLLSRRRLLWTRLDQTADVEERLGEDGAVLEHSNDPGLLDEVEPIGLAGRHRRIDGPIETADDLDGLKTRGTLARGCGGNRVILESAADKRGCRQEDDRPRQSRNSPRATTTADPPTSTFSISSSEPSTRA